jgi:hypothetical protein
MDRAFEAIERVMLARQRPLRTPCHIRFRKLRM